MRLMVAFGVGVAGKPGAVALSALWAETTAGETAQAMAASNNALRRLEEFDVWDIDRL